ncbi:MAG: tetratricopeptide repeat protein [Caldimonas sp.]
MRTKVSEALLQAKYREALAEHGKGELDKAEALYREILQAMPESFHALHMLGVLLGQRNDLARSERLLAEAVRIEPKAATAHANLGYTLGLRGRTSEAMASYERALSLQPDNTRALKGRGLILCQLRRPEEALACYEHLLRLEPDYADGWIMKGEAFSQLRRNEESIASYRKALEFDNVSNPDKVRYMLAALDGEAVPDAAPLEYIREVFDRYADTFDRHLVVRLRYRAPELLMEQLRPALPEDTIDVLDLGCGTGLCGPLLKPLARSLTGLDASPKMLEAASKKRLYDILIPGEITAWLAAQHRSFDLIVSTDVFIYIGDLAPVFAGARRALRAGGLFAFSTEAGEGAGVRLQKSLRYAHSATYLERLAAEGGWRTESLTRCVLREERRQDVAGFLVVLRRGA